MKRKIALIYLNYIVSSILIICLSFSYIFAYEGKDFSVPAGKKARILWVRIQGNKGFRILEKNKGWTVYRSWGDANAVSGLILSPGRYKIVSEDESPVQFDFVIE
ncbi:MAG: hypothetical protein P9M03_11620 [Candidatus Theseobacter exili]|nr:hypothetical protein [Candidatus Theseobacter exili]